MLLPSFKESRTHRSKKMRTPAKEALTKQFNGEWGASQSPVERANLQLCMCNSGRSCEQIDTYVILDEGSLSFYNKECVAY